MQKIKKILKITGGRAEWVDERGNDAEAPTIPLGANVALEIDVRQAVNDGLTDNLPAYPIAELAADAYYFAMDGDYDHATDPKMIRLTGITVTAGALLPDGTARTIITATVPNTNYTGLKTALLVAESLIMEGEIGGNDSGAASTFVFAFPVIVRNRVWYPDDAPESVTEDPDYLNSVQVTAFINDAVATAVAAATAGLGGEAGTSSYVYIAYASDDAGTGFNLTPSASLPYMAVITSETELDPPVIGNFAAATWLRYLGAAGADGTTTLAGLNLAPMGAWAIGTTYAENDAVRHAGAVWQSLADDNVGNEPAADSAFWQLWAQDGTDGTDAQAPIFGYNDTDDPADAGWHTTLAADDTYFRISLDGGTTWSIAKALSTAQAVIVQYNIDATTDWVTSAKPTGANYSAATGKYFRVAFTGGVYGEGQIISVGMTSQAMRLQFSATGDTETPADWHAEPAAGDGYVRFFNEAGTIQVVFTIDAGGLDITAVQLAAIIDPWHTTYTAGDHYMRVSVNSGGTYSTPIKVTGDDAPEPQVEFSTNGTDWSTSPTNAIYQRWSTDGGVTWTAAMQVKGADGAGIEIGAIGLLADRDTYDAAAIGFTYLATDVLTDGDGRPYNLLYQRSSSTQGEWSAGAIAYIGPQGPTGAASTVPGPRGADATIIPDLVFAAGDLVEDIEYGGSLTIDGIKAIAQIELYDANGDGITIERGDALENGGCIVKTKYADNETIVYFGTLDVTNGGRVRFAQGTAANQITIDGAGSMMAVTKLRLIRPSAVLPVHLVIEASADRDFASTSTVIDTAAVAADRNRVLAWDGAEFVPMPAAGFGFGYVGALVLVDMSQLAAPSYIRYRWDYVGSDTTVYRYTYFPSCGEASTADGGGAAATTGSLQFNLAGDLSGEGRWSIDEGITWRESGEIVTGLPPWTFAVTFKAVAGYTEPSDTTAAVVAVELTTATATYVSASATGNFAFVLVGSTPNLITDEADPTKCFGPPTPGFGYHIINGKLYAYGDGLHQIGAATDWTDVAGGYLGSGFFGEAGGGHAIRGAGELYAISGLNLAKIGVATDWTAVTIGYALKGVGNTLYRLSGTTITEIAAGMTLPMMSGSSGYVIGADGKLYKLVGATLTQVGAATNWTSVSAGYSAGKLAYATNSSGALFAIDDTTATQVGAATDWGSISGNSDATLPAYGQRGENGDLYALIGTTATLISEGWGLGTLHASLGQGYYMTPGGGLFRVSGSAVPAQIGTDEDWTYISGASAPLGVR